MRYILERLLPAAERVQFICFSQKEVNVANRTARAHYHARGLVGAARGQVEATFGERGAMDKHLCRGDYVTFRRNCANVCQLMTDEQLSKFRLDHLLERDAPYFATQRAVMNGDVGTIVEIYAFVIEQDERRSTVRIAAVLRSTNFQKEQRERRERAAQIGLNPLNFDLDDRSAGIVLIVKMERDESLRHVCLRDYPKSDIELAWATTTYRSQGQEFDHVVFVCSNAYARDPPPPAGIVYPMKEVFENRRCLYVATSRGKKTLGYLYALPFAAKQRLMIEARDVPYASFFETLLAPDMQAAEAEAQPEAEAKAPEAACVRQAAAVQRIPVSAPAVPAAAALQVATEEEAAAAAEHSALLEEADAALDEWATQESVLADAEALDAVEAEAEADIVVSQVGADTETASGEKRSAEALQADAEAEAEAEARDAAKRAAVVRGGGRTMMLMK